MVTILAAGHGIDCVPTDGLRVRRRLGLIDRFARDRVVRAEAEGVTAGQYRSPSTDQIRMEPSAIAPAFDARSNP